MNPASAETIADDNPSTAKRSASRYALQVINHWPALAGSMLLASGVVALPTIVPNLISLFTQADARESLATVPSVWFVGWTAILIAIVSLLTMFALWAARVTEASSRLPVYLLIAILAFCDLSGTLCFLFMKPSTISTSLPIALGLCAGAGSILYCLTGWFLQIRTRGLSIWKSLLGYCTWMTGLAVAICAITQSPAMIIASGMFWILMPAWCFVLNSVFRQQSTPSTKRWARWNTPAMLQEITSKQTISTTS